MPTFVALLRAVNVGGVTVGMAALRSMGEGAGYTGVKTFLQSGNVLLSAPAQRPSSIERKLEAEAPAGIGVATDILVRSAAEWRAAIDANPFAKEAREAPSNLHVVFLKDHAPEGAEAALRAAVTGREHARVRGREVYVVYPDGAGRSKLTLRVIERAVGRRGTARNWNTVTRIQALLPK